MNTLSQKTTAAEPSYLQAKGKMPYSLTNDYLFRALLQENNHVLKHLICALLHLRPEEVETAEIQNPIVLGKALDNRTFVLDIKVLLNNHTIINLEMQIINYLNWPERSLSYLCRNFDQLIRGQDYLEVKPVIHIGFLDFSLFPQYPEFYAAYRMLNTKNHHELTDKFTLRVVELNQIEKATEEDRRWKIDYWAALFKATTWEEAQMLAEQNSDLEEAVVTMYEMTAEDAIREQCRAREDYYRTINTFKAEIQNRENALEELNRQLAMKDHQLEQQARQIEAQSKEIEAQGKEIESQSKKVETQGRQITELSQQLDTLMKLQTMP